MSHPLDGVSRIINLSVTSVGAGATDLDLRPSAGMLWEVLFAVGTQNDGGVPCGWYMTDPDAVDYTVSEGTATGPWTVWYLGGHAENAAMGALMAPVVLTFNRYLTFRFTASAGGKTGYVRALVKEFRGVAQEA